MFANKSFIYLTLNGYIQDIKISLLADCTISVLIFICSFKRKKKKEACRGSLLSTKLQEKKMIISAKYQLNCAEYNG